MRVLKDRPLALGVIRRAHEVDLDAGLVADHPRVVTWRQLHHVARADLDFGPVVVVHLHASGHDVGQVRRLAAVRLRDRLYVRGPSPARFEGPDTDLLVAKVEDVEGTLALERA